MNGVKLTPRELAIVQLSMGKATAIVAHVSGLTAREARELAESMGPDAINRAAGAIRRGDRSYADPPVGAVGEGAPAAAEDTAPAARPIQDRGIPDDLDAVVDLQDQREGQAAPPGTAASLLGDADGVLQLLVHATPDPDTGPDRAVLTMPLARLVDADGTQTVLAEAVVEVRLNRPGVLEALDGQLFTGAEGGHLVVPVRIARRLTEDGRAAIEQLAKLLDTDGAL